jgi:hypothetical protein
MASKNKDERTNVNALIQAIQKNSLSASTTYVHVDRDAGSARHTSSGWDFLLARDDKIVFCEAKQPKGKLSSWQELTRVLIQRASCRYCVVRFSEDGKFFTIDDEKRVAIEDATIEDFF